MREEEKTEGWEERETAVRGKDREKVLFDFKLSSAETKKEVVKKNKKKKKKKSTVLLQRIAIFYTERGWWVMVN